jgi:N-methylhydantoinase B
VYYETLGGGQGASRHGPGPSGVHVGMSNTRNTPIEVLEMELPLRVEEYALRRNSGGAGTGALGHRGTGEQGHAGGDGVVRQVRVLQPCMLSLVTDRRRVAPRGASGGGDGLPGRNLVNGEEVGSKVAMDLATGDVVRIETPGGGGFGAAP